MSDELSPYGVAIHEAAHAVMATVFGAPWHVVYVRERHGALLPDKEGFQELLAADPDGPWPMELFAMVSLAGPIADARYSLNMNNQDRRVGGWFGSLEQAFGGAIDIPTAQMWAREAGASYETLADDTIKMLNEDKIWLAVERVADALFDRRTLITTDVNRLVYGRAKGVQ